MTQQNRLGVCRAVAVASIAAMLLIPSFALGSNGGGMTEEFHKTYPLSAQGRIEIDNINGAVHIGTWNRNDVQVDAIKTAHSKERLDEAQIEVNSSTDRLSIRTHYPGHDHTFWNDTWHDNPANVEYTLTVPRQARLDQIKLVNGALDLHDLAGEVRANCVNGHIEARNLQGRSELKAVNGKIEAHIGQMPASAQEFSSVNGSVRVTLPSDAGAELDANTISGGISNEFGLPVSRHRFVGQSLHGELGGGGTRVKLSTVNGGIEIRHAGDGRPLSPAKNLERDRSRDREDDDEDDEI
jgi:DUF4097 and DUF4098 domain-containing protein YvlB